MAGLIYQIIESLLLKIFFSAWIAEDAVYPYAELREKYASATRIPRGFKEALEAIEDAWQALPV